MTSTRSTLAALLLSVPLLAGPAQAALVDGSYTVTGDINRAFVSFSLDGAFDVIGGLISGLSITLDLPDFSGVPSSYSGPGTNEATGTMLSAALTLDNRPSFATGTGFLNLSTDGTWSCGGLSVGSSTDLCQLRTEAFGTAPNEKSGTYTVSRVTAAVPLPASGLLLLAALAAGAVTMRRRD